MRMPKGTRNLATGSSGSTHVGATSQTAVGTIAVAVKHSSGRLALGPRCPAPTSNFDDAGVDFGLADPSNSRAKPRFRRPNRTIRGDASVHSVGSRGSLLFGVHSSPIGVQSRTSQGEHSVASDQIRGNSPRTQACFERDPAPPPSLLEKSVRMRLSCRHAVSIISGETQRSDCLQGTVKLSEGRAKGDFPRATIRR